RRRSNMLSASTTRKSAPVKITGQYLAKASHYPKQTRAADAAAWICGEVVVEPTIALAADVFGISPPLVKAQLGLRAKHLGNRNGGAPALSDDVVERMVTEIGVERIFRVVEKLTQPQLPLAAAE